MTLGERKTSRAGPRIWVHWIREPNNARDDSPQLSLCHSKWIQ
jgi:hypothetical protein